MTNPDGSIIGSIDALVDEEHRLRSGRGTDPDRLREIEVELNRCWDLLRQRRARREFGENPDEAAVRPASTVENYRQ